MAVQEIHRLGEIVEREIGGPRTGIEACIQTEVNSIRTVSYRGPKAIPVTGWSQQLRSRQSPATATPTRLLWRRPRAVALNGLASVAERAPPRR